jgi:histidyl-tRNA synthetase
MTAKKESKKEPLQAPRGMHDIFPDDYLYYQAIYDKVEEIAEYYGFSPIQTPHIEQSGLFSAAAGETTDIIEKQMYALKPKGGDNLSLRPEGTPGVMRAYIEHGMHTWPQPVMFWYKGSFFRHEKPQRGRLRELQQFGLEILGEEKAISESTIIKIMSLALEELGLGPITVHVNSLGDKECRNAYKKELVTYYKKKNKHLCKDCKRRLVKNPLRLLDCKEEKCIELKKEAPQMVNHLCPECKNHFKETIELLEANNVAYTLDTHLVRGLDYYTRTVFEFFTETKEGEIGAPMALGAGGRYDYLGKILSNRDVPACGGALGIDRLVLLMKEKGITPRQKRKPKVFLIQLGQAAKLKSFGLIEMLRKAKVPASQSISKDSLRGQLKVADRLRVAYALILGQKEAMDNTVIVRDMSTGSQDTVKIEKIVEYLKTKD